MLHTFIIMEFSMEFTHITFCEIEDFFVNEGGEMLTNMKVCFESKALHTSNCSTSTSQI